MKEVSHKNLYVRNPNTGEFEPLMAIRGESAYDIAVRLGKFTGTEEEWANFIEIERAAAVKSVEDKGAETLESIPDDYTALAEEVARLEADKIDKTSIAQELGDSEEKVLSQKAMTDALADFAALRNLFNKTNRTDGVFLSYGSAGTFAIDGFFTSGFIKVDANRTYHINHTSSSKLVHEYDKDYNFIAHKSQYTITTEANTCYIRFSSPSDELDTSMLLADEWSDTYIPYRLYIKDDAISANIARTSNTAAVNRVNLIDKNNVVSGEFVGCTDGGFLTNADFWRTDFIEIEPNTEYTLRYINQCAFYSDKNNVSFIEGISGYSQSIPASSLTFTTPSNAKYVVVCGHSSQLDTDQLEKGDKFTGYRDFEAKEISMDSVPKQLANMLEKSEYTHNLSSILRNATETVKITLVGDSITHGAGGTGFNMDGTEGEEIDGTGYYRNPNGYCWANLFKQHLESKYNCEVTNNACTGTETQHLLYCMSLGKLIHGDEDIVICMMGTNNRINASYRDSYISDLQQIYDFCKSHNILFIPIANIPATVADESRENGTFSVRACHMEDINAMLNSFCVDNGIEYVDVYTPFYNYCLTSGTSLETLLPDGLHPNDDGHYLIYRIVCKAIGIVAKIKGATW